MALLLLLVLPLLLLPLLTTAAADGRHFPVLPWDSSDHQQLQLTSAGSLVQCGARCLRWVEVGTGPCVALAFSAGQCRLLACPVGHSITDGVCKPDCPAGTQLQGGQCVVQCPAGWSQSGGACYLRVTEPRSWAASEAHCAAQLSGAHLASIHSAAEEAFVWDLMSDSDASPVNYHIGFEHLPSEPSKVFHWVDGTSVGYTHWRSDQPNFDQTKRLGTSMYVGGKAWCDIFHDVSSFQSVCKFAPSSD